MNKIQRKIKQEAESWGIGYDVYAVELTQQQIDIAEKYSKVYCRNGKCEYNYSCCGNCVRKTPTGCNQEDLNDVCIFFFCSFIIDKIPEEERHYLITYHSLLYGEIEREFY